MSHANIRDFWSVRINGFGDIPTQKDILSCQLSREQLYRRHKADSKSGIACY